jgi:hypothetical protein
LKATQRPLRSVPANAAVLESGRHAGEALSATMGGIPIIGFTNPAFPACAVERENVANVRHGQLGHLYASLRVALPNMLRMSAGVDVEEDAAHRS